MAKIKVTLVKSKIKSDKTSGWHVNRTWPEQNQQ